MTDAQAVASLPGVVTELRLLLGPPRPLTIWARRGDGPGRP